MTGSPHRSPLKRRAALIISLFLPAIPGQAVGQPGGINEPSRCVLALNVEARSQFLGEILAVQREGVVFKAAGVPTPVVQPWATVRLVRTARADYQPLPAAQRFQRTDAPADPGGLLPRIFGPARVRAKLRTAAESAEFGLVVLLPDEAALQAGHERFARTHPADQVEWVEVAGTRYAYNPATRKLQKSPPAAGGGHPSPPDKGGPRDVAPVRAGAAVNDKKDAGGIATGTNTGTSTGTAIDPTAWQVLARFFLPVFIVVVGVLAWLVQTLLIAAFIALIGGVIGFYIGGMPGASIGACIGFLLGIIGRIGELTERREADDREERKAR